MVSYLIREQFYHYSPHLKSLEYRHFPTKIRNTLYILCLKEWNLDSLMYETVWNPIKRLARTLSFLNEKNVFYFFVPTFSGGLFLLYHKEYLPTMVRS